MKFFVKFLTFSIAEMDFVKNNILKSLRVSERILNTQYMMLCNLIANLLLTLFLCLEYFNMKYLLQFCASLI